MNELIEYIDKVKDNNIGYNNELTIKIAKIAYYILYNKEPTDNNCIIIDSTANIFNSYNKDVDKCKVLIDFIKNDKTNDIIKTILETCNRRKNRYVNIIDNISKGEYDKFDYNIHKSMHDNCNSNYNKNGNLIHKYTLDVYKEYKINDYKNNINIYEKIIELLTL